MADAKVVTKPINARGRPPKGCVWIPTADKKNKTAKSVESLTDEDKALRAEMGWDKPAAKPAAKRGKPGRPRKAKKAVAAPATKGSVSKAQVRDYLRALPKDKRDELIKEIDDEQMADARKAYESLKNQIESLDKAWGFNKSK